MAARTPRRRTTRKQGDGGTPTVPSLIYAQASPHSVGGVSLFEAQDRITAETAPNFFSDEEIITRAVLRLQDAGFDVLQATETTINIAGSPETYQRAFNTTITAEERPVIKSLGVETTATFLDSPDTELSGLISTANTPFADVLEGVAIEEPRYFMAPSMFPPLKTYWHLEVPADISLGDNADMAQRLGITGQGIKVAMIDTGHYSQHPFFVQRGYRVAPVTLGPATANPAADEVGHGTGESANLFAVAPDVTLLPVKLNFVNTIGGFNAGVGLRPDIITCSWGSSNRLGPLSAADMALAAAISAAVAAGITVVFSAGNGHWGFPGQHPDVISAGGTYMHPDGALEASDYASGFMSNLYAGRRVPDLCGLVGMQPKAIYIMLPLEPGDQIDVELAGGAFPNGDETANNDGWAAFSGTSAAAPQLAGAAALVKQTCPRLGPAEIKDVLTRTARDVTQGHCNPATGGNPAGPGPDLATGYGLVDAHKAAMVARVRCLSIQPISRGPITPITPVTPVRPVRPITITPVRPIRPITPQPIAPQPIVPPVRPIEPPAPTTASPAGPAMESAPGTAEMAGAGEAPGPLSDEEARALEEMVIKGEIDLDM